MVVLTRASSDFSCPKDQLRVSHIAGGSYRASGCDHQQVYDCIVDKTYTCIPEGHDSAPRDAEGEGTSDKESVAEKEDREANPTVDPPSGTPRAASLCTKVYQHIDDLTAAWGEWHPERKAKSSPGKVEFLSVCHDLSAKQQMCLLMPYGRDYRVNCAKTLQTMTDDLSQRLDDLFLEP
jgi:hypothetical protein